MALQRDIPRTAAFTWSPGAAGPLIATGTRAGAVDADFSSETQLELWDLALGESSSAAAELKPVAQVSTDSRFHDIAWGQPKNGEGRGIIAGGLENGSLDLWDAGKLLEKQDGAHMSRTNKHTGAIKALQFNPFRPELLATAGQKGELYVSDTNNIANPFRLGNNAGRMDDFECLDWNKQVPHIMVTGSSGGFVTVWDVKAKKESLTLNNSGRKAVSAVAWDPAKSTRLITAVPLDTDPMILVWDLRNSNAPEKVIRGHESGVLSLSWCQQDPDLLLSCGKDNRTVCWNPQSGESYGDFPVVTNWTFQTRWNPHNPSLLATASFDGKIAVRSLQNTKKDAPSTEANLALDGADFFANAATQAPTSSFSLPKPPKWLERPVSASFGFGGKLISLSQVGDPKGSRTSQIRLSTFAVDSEISEISGSFAKTLAEGDLKSICENHVSKAHNEAEKDDWKIMETLVAPNPRKEFVKYLGFSDSAEEQTNGEKADSEERAAGGEEDDPASFFDKAKDDEDFLSGLGSSKGAKTNDPFELYNEKDSEVDKSVTRCLMLGKFQKAMELCLAEDRLSDAFMIAICGGQSAIEKVQAAYFKKQTGGPKYVRLLASVVGKSLWDIVYNANLGNWKEVMATLCTYASSEEFPDLCEALGDRLQEEGEDSDKTEAKQSASFCYIAGSKLNKVVGIWIAQLQKSEEAQLESASAGNSFSVHARALQDFIEKVTVFRQATQYKDTMAAGDEPKLAPLYEKYVEYADIVAAHGQLDIADNYLRLLPESYQTAQSARERVQQATKKVAAAPASSRMPPAPSVPSAGYGFPAPAIPQPQYNMDANAARPYMPHNASQPSGMYAPPQSQYDPSGYQPINPMQLPNRGMMVPPPSRSMNASPAIAPPSQAGSMPNWNDTPDDWGRTPTPRRNTPSLPPAQAPVAPYGAPMNKPPQPQPIPPPPKTTGPPPGGPMALRATPDRPPSASNPYAPTLGSQPPVTHASPPPSAIPRGASPYNAPPSGMPPSGSSRYAPAPAPAAAAPAQPGPPPGYSASRSPPPPNPYAPAPGGPPHSMGAPRGAPPAGPPPTGPPPRGGPPPAAGAPPPTSSGFNSAPPPPPAAKAQAKNPPGDRSHIPENARPVFEILNADMQRVKAKAPASFTAQVQDTEKRLSILFDHLNNETLLKPNTVADMVVLAQALQAKDFDRAQQIHLDIMTHRQDECTNWMTGVKRLIGMSKATS